MTCFIAAVSDGSNAGEGGMFLGTEEGMGKGGRIKYQ